MKEKSFTNVKCVIEYLQSQNYKIKRSSVYEHAKHGKLKPKKDGIFYLSDVERYAKLFLKLKDNTLPGMVSRETTQKRRVEAETRKMEAQALHWETKTKIESGSYVEKTAFEHALSQRAMLFKNDIDTFCRSKAADIINLTGGDKDKIPDLIEYLLDQTAKWLNTYSADQEFIIPTSIDVLPEKIDHSFDNENDNSE